MINKYFAQINGVVLVIFGLIGLYSYVYKETIEATKLSGNLYFSVFVTFVFCCMAVYGGFQLFRLQEVGRRLAMVWWFWILCMIVVTRLPGYLSREDPFLAPSKIKYLPIIIGIYMLYVLAFVSLLNHKMINLMNTNVHLIRRIGIILSYCMPGLGRALTGSFLVGIGLFGCYVFLIKSLFLRPNLIEMTGLMFLVWRIFSFIDIAAVKKAYEFQQTEMAGT